MQKLDVAIVGGGIAGASLAWHLAGERSVVLLERESQPGYHTTGRSAAMFMESYGPPMVRALTRASRAFYESPPAGFVDRALLSPRGALYVATHDTAEQLAVLREELVATGSEVEMLDAAATLRLAPCLRPELVHGGLYERDAQDIDVAALLQGYLRGMRAKGGVLSTASAVVAARREAAGWTLTLGGGEALQCSLVVNAAGAWGDEVATLLGAARIGLVPRRRSAFTFRPPEGMDVHGWPVVAAIDEGWYFKPDAGQLLGSPANADDTTPHDVVAEELDIATAIWRIEEATTLSIRRPTATWAGLRTFTPDGELAIGWDATVPGLFWLVGQGGYGIQSAAGAAELAASLILAQQPLPEGLRAQGVDPAALSPARFQ